MDEHIDKKITHKFSKLNTIDDVSSLLGTKTQNLSYILYILPFHKKYKIFSIPKKNGQVRTITAPIDSLKTLQRKLNNILQEIFIENYKNRSHYIYGFLRNQQISGNAQCHTQKDFVINIDLKDFFSQLTFPRIRGMFINYPFCVTPEAATVLTKLTTWKNVEDELPSLPQGAPTSPIISNFICARLDAELYHLARKFNFIYSRYADDISFSVRGRELPNILGKLENNKFILSSKVRKIIEDKNNFKINDDKIRCMSKFNRQEVTGLTVNDKVNVPHRYIKEIRAILFDWRKNGPSKALMHHLKNKRKHYNTQDSLILLSRIVKGKLLFLKQIRGNDFYYYKLYKYQYDLLNHSDYPVISTSRTADLAQGIYILEAMEDNTSTSDIEKKLCEKLGEGPKCFQGTGFMLNNIGLVTCNHVIDNFDIKNISVFLHPKAGQNKHIIKEIINTIPYRDCAVLKLTNNNKRPCFNYSTKEPQIHQKVIIAGYPHYANEYLTVIEASIITKKNMMETDFFSVDKPITEGNSGGPVFNTNMEVIGMAVKGGKDIYSALENGSYFIPIKYVVDNYKPKDLSL